MNRLIITRISGRILTALMNDNKAVQLEFEDAEDSILGDIYIGKVKDVVKNINAAFVELKRGLTGYYSLDENPVHLFASGTAEKNTSGKERNPAEESLGRTAGRDADSAGEGMNRMAGRDAGFEDKSTERTAGRDADSADESAKRTAGRSENDSANERMNRTTGGDKDLTDESTERTAGRDADSANESTDRTAKRSDPPACRLRPGDEIIVQVARAAVKSKAPVLTSCLTFTGRFCVLTVGRNRLSFSGKIKDGAWKRQMAEQIKPYMEPSFGLIVRTNAREAEPAIILAELERLKKQYHRVTEAGRFRTCYSLLYSDIPAYAARLRDTYSAAMEEILTDDREIFDSLQTYLDTEGLSGRIRLRLYEDPLVSLPKLYSIEKNIHEALQKKVWLKSGGYLVIEPTEAMTVIDVNTGKYSGKKIMRETIRAINLEAAKEAARQIRLRNLSGIILIDFINMEREEDKAELMERLTEYCAEDPIKTAVVDMTRLGLAEITRKKVRRPLHEQVRESVL